MRFIFGLVAGALVTLFVAAAFDVPADHLVGKVVHTTARFTDKIAMVKPTPSPTAEATDTSTALLEDSPLEEPIAVAADMGIDPGLNLEVPVSAEPGGVEEMFLPEPLEIVEMTANSETTDASESVLASVPAEAAMVESPVLPAAATAQEATAWGPFHSEASARGFARRLSREAGRAFNVDKRGPGNYLVTFAYTDNADLDAVRAQIAQVTGIPQT